MLIRFAVSNFRSIDDEVELSLVSTQRFPESRFHQPSIGETLLPTLAIYGPNASGKTNLLLSLCWIRDAITSSLRFWENDIPVIPFAFTNDVERPTTFELEMMIDGDRCEYYLEVNHDRVIYEAAYRTREGERTLLFERDGEHLTFDAAIIRQEAIRELLTPRTLVMSIALRYTESSLIGFINAIQRMRFLGGPRWAFTGPFIHLRSVDDQIWSDDESVLQPSPFDERQYKGKALNWLRMADLGITDVQLVQDTGANDAALRKRVQLIHATAHGELPLDFMQESEGTRAWFRLIAPTITALETGSTLIFDELDASLHPVLSAQLLEFFHDQDVNTKGAQLLFSAHNTGLMRHLLGDEIWLTEKTDGITSVEPLSAFDSERVRQSTDLESGYLHGRFGGLPNLDLTQLLRGKGVID